MNTTAKALTVCFLLTVAAAGVATSMAASPPVYINYQGVLRDSADNPLDGTHDMVFRFYSGLDEEILIDRHTTAQGGAVTVSGGLFSVALGTGSTADGSGPGTYSSLVEVFRDYNEVHLEVQIGADGAPGTEILTPRTRVISAAYALNASNLAGVPVTSLLRSNESDAYTFGTLTFGPTTTLDLGGTLIMDGAVTKSTTDHVANLNADLLDNMDSSAFAASAHGHNGGEIIGPVGEASNADTLDGLDSLYFLNTSSATQSKAGPLIVDTVGVGSTALEAVGDSIGGFFSTATGTGFANVATGSRGIEGFGSEAGGFFGNSVGTGYAYVGALNLGVRGFGATAGGFFTNTSSPLTHSYLAYDGVLGYYGLWASGEAAGAYITDSDFTSTTYISKGGRGVEAEGDEAGGYFYTGSGSGHAWVGYLDEGISAHGTVQGGYFQDSDSTGQAHVAYGDRGIEASGSQAGGYFADSNSSGYASVGIGDLGIAAYGAGASGYFQNLNGTSEVWVSDGSYGIKAYGTGTGGYFRNTNTGSDAYVAWNNFGVNVHGDLMGGAFYDGDQTGYAFVGHEDRGIDATGNEAGGYFGDRDQSGYAYVGYGERGIWAKGTFAGGTFSHPDNVTFWSDVATPSHKIVGTGIDGFVQNHPFDENRVLYYSAPEGDEVAVYTRGSARLVAGEVAVALGETFRWVANPDLGLTAHLTPHGDCLGLYVASLSPEELVVRELGGGTSDVVFDYIVYGLRIGFEKHAVVDTKQREAPLPASEVFESKYAADPELRQFNALERYKSMKADVSGVAADEIEMEGAAALREAILASGWQQRGRLEQDQERPESAMPEPPAPRGEREPASEGGGKPGTIAVIEQASVFSENERRADAPGPYPTFPVSEPVEAGDLMVLDPENPGRLRRCASVADANVIGIVVGDAVAGDGDPQVPVALSNLAVVKADAGYGEIRAGDLLTSSFTTGHAMVALEIVPGTIIGKALEPLETGTGLIKVLVMPR